MSEPRATSLPADARRSLLLYNALFPFVFLALLPGLFLRMARRGNYRNKFGQRFGLYSDADRRRFAEGEWLWLHSISVGETLLALKLAREIHALAPGMRIAISVTTSTGFAVAQPHGCEWLEVIYNPVDAPWIVRKALTLVRPSRLIFIEAVWPNLLASAKRRGIPVAFLPRLSPRSESRFRKFRSITGPIFRLVDVMAASEPEDIARWTSLGAHADRIRITGNPKFDYIPSGGSRVAEFRAFLQQCGVRDEAPVFLAGSTFEGEERIVAEVFRELRMEFPDLFLIIVPRHAERTESVLSDLHPLGLRIARRSIGPDHCADALIVDTTGELRDWYSLATVVFIGKSLTSTGGQNPVEAVMAGKPVVFGPHMENFAPIVRRWLAAGAAVEVQNAVELKNQVALLLKNPESRTELSTQAREIASMHEGATTRAASVLMGIASPIPVE